MRALVLVGLTGLFGKLWVGGELGNYISTRYLWLAGLGAVLLAILAADAVFAVLGHRARHFHGWADHIHRPPTRLVMAIVAVPLFLGALVPAQALGARAVSGDLSLDAGPRDAAVVSSSDSLRWTVLDWLRAYAY